MEGRVHGTWGYPRTRQRHEDKAAALDPACSSWNAGDVGRLKPFSVICVLFFLLILFPTRIVYAIVSFLMVSAHRFAL